MTTEEIIYKSKLDWYRENNKVLYRMLKEKDIKLRRQETEILQLRKELNELARGEQKKMERIPIRVA